MKFKKINMKNTIIISGFPGIGKTYLTELYKGTDIIVQDSDSSNFSWLEPGIRNPDFPNNYINHIKELNGKVDYILISSHENVRQGLAKEGINYVLVYPDPNLKAIYIQRYKKRNSSIGFINNINNTFHSFVSQCHNDIYAKRVMLTEDNYLSDIIGTIHDLFKED